MTASHSSSAHVDEHPVAQDAGVVDEHVEVTERVNRLPHDPLGTVPRGDVVAVRLCPPTEGPDVGDDVVSGTTRRARTVGGGANVVHDHAGASGGERDGVLATDATPGASHDAGSPGTQPASCTFSHHLSH